MTAPSGPCAEELAGTGIPVADRSGRHRQPAGPQPVGIPLYLRAAVDVGLNGQDRAIDMVDLGGDGLEGTTSW